MEQQGFAIYQTALGGVCVRYQNDVITALQWIQEEQTKPLKQIPQEKSLEQINQVEQLEHPKQTKQPDQIPPAAASTKTNLTETVYTQLVEYLAGARTRFDFPYQLQGTAFQKKVWGALCDIPYGETRSYQEIAAAVGSPKACRAVGMANNKNPMHIVVPCHRVIGANGALVGYAGGIARKETLLFLEQQGRR